MGMLTGAVRWVRSLDRTLADVLLVAAVTLTSAVQVVWGGSRYGDGEPSWLSAVFMLLENAPLAWRRRAPVTVLVLASSAASIAAVLRVPSGQWIAVLIALYTVAANCDRRRSIWAFVLTTGFFTALNVAGIWYADIGVDSLIGNLLFFTTAWILGDNLRTRRAYTRELEDRAVRLEQAREADAQAAASAERGRIARELHDVVAHHVSVIAVQAGAARRVAETRPDSAKEALASIEATARQAGVELRRLLGVLRKGGHGGRPLAPQPRLDELAQLVQQARAAGLAVELTVEGERRPLPAAVHLSAYRIVQEALTNTIKHANASAATVLVRYRPRQLELEVADNGRGVVDDSELATGGHGLVGMHERVDLFGGELTVGPRHGGGFKVSARLPLDVPTRERRPDVPAAEPARAAEAPVNGRAVATDAD
jgi:signal transduction histidine kinase